jgi:hypothetical protein
MFFSCKLFDDTLAFVCTHVKKIYGQGISHGETYKILMRSIKGNNIIVWVKSFNYVESIKKKLKIKVEILMVQRFMYIGKQLDDLHFFFFEYYICKDSMVLFVLKLHGSVLGGGGGKGIPSSNIFSFKDAVKSQPSIVASTYPPNAYILDKSNDFLALKVLEKEVFDLLSHYVSNTIIY